MKIPFVKCKHKKVEVKRYDHGIEKRVTITCLKGCKELLGEMVGTSMLALDPLEEATDAE